MPTREDLEHDAAEDQPRYWCEACGTRCDCDYGMARDIGRLVSDCCGAELRDTPPGEENDG